MKAPTALVTGASGFIGSHVVERLVEDGHVVHAVDLVGPTGPAEATFHRRDLASEPLIDLVREVDVVYHLAGRPGVRASWELVDDYARDNVLATRRLLDACAIHGTRCVFASSSSVYGDVGDLPAAESLPPRPISPYGATKAAAEALARAHGAVILRYFTVYGPRQRPDMAIARFIHAAFEGLPIRVFGDGRQRRDFTYVGDIVEGTVLAARRGSAGETYNLASSSPVTLAELLDVLGELVARDLRVEYTDAQAGDVRDTWGDVAKAAAELAYAPRTLLADGLAAQLHDALARRERGSVAVS